MSSPWGKVLGIAISLLVVAAVILAVWSRVAVIKPRLALLRESLLEPYLKLQMAGDFSAAWESSTDAEYRQRFSRDEYLAFHQETQASHGSLERYSFIKDSSPFNQASASARYQIYMDLYFEKGHEIAVYEIKWTEGGYLLTGAFGGGAADRMKPTPW